MVPKRRDASADLISPGLRAKLIEAATSIFSEEGNEALSMRRVAHEVGCSQMAMYRYFANKDALIQHICVQLYASFTQELKRQLDRIPCAAEKIKAFSAALIRFACRNPDHYSLVFLVRHSDPEIFEAREQLGREFLLILQGILRAALPADTSSVTIKQCMRQVLFCVHGAAALLIAHPKAYALNERRAAKDTEDVINTLLAGVRERQKPMAVTGNLEKPNTSPKTRKLKPRTQDF